MPFEERKGKDVKLSLGYGEQTDPTTGKTYFHHGIDFDVRCYTLAAVASGIVSGIGNDPIPVSYTHLDVYKRQPHSSSAAIR